MVWALSWLSAGLQAPTLDPSVMDEVVTVETEVALETARSLATQEGIFCGVSSGAAVAAAIEVRQSLPCS